jgi:tetratricopeptide (TPR) repeat protein
LAFREVATVEETMEAANNQGNPSLPSAVPASGASDEDAASKLHFEVTLPPELGGELKAWRKAFERYTDVMERWLANGLPHPGFPPMPWTMAPPQPDPLPPPPPPAPSPPVVAVAPPAVLEQPPLLAPQTAPPAPAVPQPTYPDHTQPLLVEEPYPLLAQTPAQEESSGKDAAATLAEAGSADTVLEAPQPAAAGDADAIEQAMVLAQQGERHRLAGDKGKALTCYEQALALDPNCSQVFLGRASILIEQGRLSEALLDCNSALEREPQRAVLYVLRGMVHARLGNLKRALEEAEDAIRFDPQLPSGYMLRGIARFKKGRLEEALSDVRAAIRLRPNDPKFHAELARMLMHAGEYEEAASIYAEMLELAPNYHEARLHRGAALREAGDAAEAEAELNVYLRHRPKSAAAYYQRGLSRLAQRNYALAMTDFDKAIGLNPNDKTAYEAKEKTLQQWEGTARQGRSGSSTTQATASTVALTATDTPAAVPAWSPPAAPMLAPAKASPPKTKPSPPRPRRWRDDDDEPPRWLRPAKWACSLVLVAMLGYFFVPMVWAYVKIRSIPQEDNIPVAEAKVTAAELWERYLTQAEAARNQLGDRYIEVQGIVEEVKQARLGEKDVVQIVLMGDRYGGQIVCTLVPTKSLNQGVRLSRVDRQGFVKVIGKCTGKADKSVNLDEVRLIEVRTR